MSLVNDMLRDLAHQQQTQVVPADDIDVLLTRSSLSKKSHPKILVSFAVFALLLSTILGAIFLSKKILLTAPLEAPMAASNAHLENPESIIELDSSEIEPLKSDPLKNDPPENKLLDNQVDDSARATSVTTSNEPAQTGEINNPAPVTPSKENAAHIDNLLASARLALSSDRLTSPVEDNAFTYYQQILRLEPQNKMALAGIENIAQRYVELGQHAAEQGNYQRASTLVNRALFVAPAYSPAVEMASVLLQRANEPQFESQADQSMKASVASVAIQQNNAGNSAQDDNTSAPSVSIKNLDVVAVRTTPSIAANISTAATALPESGATFGANSVTPNLAWQDRQAAEQGELLISQGQGEAAQIFLQNFVAAHDQPIRAAQVLMEFYLTQPDLDALRILLQESTDYLPALIYTRFSARLLIAQGHEVAAISALEKNLPQAEADENYRSLLAGLYHKAARYQESASSYRRLIEVFGQKPAYWLGLALALDALQQDASALEAYRRISMGEVTQVQVKNYVEQRIAALSLQ